MILIPWKLVRDKVPERIEACGAHSVVKQLDGPAFRKVLAKKLVEEAKEVGAAKDRADLINELADLEEVMDAYRVANIIPLQEVRHARMIKFANAGGFGKGFFLYMIYGLKAWKK